MNIGTDSAMYHCKSNTKGGIKCFICGLKVYVAHRIINIVISPKNLLEIWWTTKNQRRQNTLTELWQPYIIFNNQRHPGAYPGKGEKMCESCQMLNINGINCHESGCPDAWRDYKRECDWCGTEFEPEEDYHNCCSAECYQTYVGY